MKELKKEVGNIKNEQIFYKEELRMLSDRLETKMESNFQGLWNVLSDLNTRLAKMESFSNLIDICKE